MAMVCGTRPSVARCCASILISPILSDAFVAKTQACLRLTPPTLASTEQWRATLSLRGA